MARARTLDLGSTGRGYAKLMWMYSGTGTDCGSTIVHDADEDEIVIYQEATGATSTQTHYFQYQLPDDFWKFEGVSDDLTIRVKQVAGGTDMTLTVNVFDNAGTDIDDDTIATAAVTGSWAQQDCALSTETGTTLNGGDHIVVQVTLVGTHNVDDAKITIPKVRCLLYPR